MVAVLVVIQARASTESISNFLCVASKMNQLVAQQIEKDVTITRVFRIPKDTRLK